jgi:LCP family protein required for cell wall assembly
MAMSDEREGPSEYDWLYSSGSERPDRRNPPKKPERPWAEAADNPDADDDAPSRDDEATHAVPRDAGGDGPADPEATRAMALPASEVDDPQAPQPGHADAGSQPEPADAAGASDHTEVIERPADADAQSPSFGGVYPAPAPGTQRRTDPSPVARRPAPPSTRPPAKKATADGGGGTGRRNYRKWAVRGVLIVLAAWLIFLIVVPIWAWQHISKVDAEPNGARPSDTPGTTYLLVGSDSRAGLSKAQRGDLGANDVAGQRTDTIIMLHVPSGDGPRLLLSIPRDSYVDIPGHGMNKINAAYSLGGPKLLVQTVEKATNVRVDDYIEVGFTGFVDIVDAVGGITVCPKTAINDPKAGGLKMKKGCQEVDGRTALEYSRSRDFRLGDITRAEHQREVITQVGKKAASWQTIVFPWRYWKVNHAAAESLVIGDNVGPIDLTRFAWAMAHTGGSDSKRCVVPYTSLGTPTDVGSVVTWDENAADALFQAIREDDTASITCSANGQ